MRWNYKVSCNAVFARPLNFLFEKNEIVLKQHQKNGREVKNTFSWEGKMDIYRFIISKILI